MPRPRDKTDIEPQASGGQPTVWRRIFSVAGWLIAAALGALAISASKDASEQLHLRMLLSSVSSTTQLYADQEHARLVGLMADKAISRGDAMGGLVSVLSLAKTDQKSVLGPATIASLRQGLIDNREAALMPLHGGPATHAHLSADGKHVVSLDTAGAATLWILDNPRPRGLALPNPPGTTSTDAQFSPDGQNLVTTTNDGQVRLRRVADPQTSDELLPANGSAVSALVFSPDGRFLAIAKEDGSLQLADLHDSTRKIVTLPNQTRPVRHIAFSSDKRFMATAGTDPGGLVLVWTLTGAEPSALDFHTGGEIRSVSFGAREAGLMDHLMTVSLIGVRMEPVVQLWWPNRPLGSDRLVTFGRTYGLDARFSPDGKFLLLSEFGTAAAVQSHSLDRSWTLGAADPVDNVVLSRFLPDGESAVTIAESGLIRLWSWGGEPQIRAQFSGHADLVEAAEVSADGHWLMTASADDTIRIWDLNHPQPGLTRLSVAEEAAASRRPSRATTIDTAALQSTDGRWLLVNAHSGDTAPTLWDLRATPPTSQSLQADNLASFSSGGFSPDGHAFALISSQGELWLGKLADSGAASLQLLPPVPGADYRVAAFTSDGQRLAAVASNGIVAAWDFWRTPLAPDLHARAQAGSGDHLLDAAFSPDGDTLAVTLIGADNATPGPHTLVWTMKIDGPPHVMMDWTEPAPSRIAVASDNRTLLLARDDGGVSTLPANSPRLDLAHKLGGLVTDRLARPEAPRRIVVSPDRHWAVALSWDRRALLFDLRHPNRSFPLAGHADIVNAAAFDTLGQHLATVSDDGTIRLWELAEDQLPAASMLDLHAGSLNFVAFDERMQRLVIVGPMSGPFLWDIKPPEDLVREARGAVTRCLTDAQRLALGLPLVGDAQPSIHQIRPASSCPGD